MNCTMSGLCLLRWDAHQEGRRDPRQEHTAHRRGHAWTFAGIGTYGTLEAEECEVLCAGRMRQDDRGCWCDHFISELNIMNLLFQICATMCRRSSRWRRKRSRSWCSAPHSHVNYASSARNSCKKWVINLLLFANIGLQPFRYNQNPQYVHSADPSSSIEIYGGGTLSANGKGRNKLWALLWSHCAKTLTQLGLISKSYLEKASQRLSKVFQTPYRHILFQQNMR